MANQYSSAQANQFLTHNSAEAQTNHNCPLNIPPCYLQNPNIPVIYMQIWEKVRKSSSDFCDKDKLYQTLLLTKLSSNVLAQIWGFVNRTVPGELTRNELIVMLGIVALVQQNKPDPIGELYKVLHIPSPVFTLNYSNLSTHDTQANSDASPTKVVNPIEEFSDFECAQISNQSSPVTNEKIVVNETRDRYSYFREIEETTPNKEDETLTISSDDFGDFFSHCDKENPHQSSPNNLPTTSQTSSVKARLLFSYAQLLEKVHKTVFGAQEEHSVLEAFSSEDGDNFIRDLYEIHQISERISDNLFSDFIKQCPTSTKAGDEEDRSKCRNILEEINNKWATISGIFKKARPQTFAEHEARLHCHPLSLSSSVPSSSLSSLGVCTICSASCTEASSLLFAGFRYHTSCANFWLNCVESSLPN